MSSTQHSAAGRIHDPVFIFMIAAMILAAISSIALRTVSSRSGSASAHADGDDVQLPAFRPPPPTESGVK